MTTSEKPRTRYRAETEAERAERIERARQQGLSKMCSCTTHEGPCWAHTNKLLKAMNRDWFQDLLDKNCDLELGCQGFIVRDQPRISGLCHALSMHSIEIVPLELCPPLYVFRMSGRQIMHPSIQRWIKLRLFTPWGNQQDPHYLITEYRQGDPVYDRP